VDIMTKGLPTSTFSDFGPVYVSLPTLRLRGDVETYRFPW
jgi:hypothetical protein